MRSYFLDAIVFSANKDEKLVQLELAQAWNRSDIVEYSEMLGHITETMNWTVSETTEAINIISIIFIKVSLQTAQWNVPFSNDHDIDFIL